MRITQESLKICNGCGEIYDTSIDAEAIHHSQPEHAPLLPPRWQPRRQSHAIMTARAA